MLAKSTALTRNVMMNFVRHGSHGGVPGANVPFNIHGRYRLTAMYIAFFGSGLALPFMVLRHQLLKK